MNINKLFKIFLVICLLSLLTSTLLAQDDEVEQELWSYIQRQSEIWYSSYINMVGLADAGAWAVPIERAFARLTKNSGEKDFVLKYAVLDDSSFNAACFPGGQIIINSGTLYILEYMIMEELGTNAKKMKEDELNKMREEALAPILAHELGHYYNRHTLKYMRKQWNLSEIKSDSIDLSLITFSQQNEFEADYTGYILLQRADYDPHLMIDTLEILNGFQQDALASYPEADFNNYFSTHPSPHARLAIFESENQEFHIAAASLEQAFSDIQIGKNLKNALNTIEKALNYSPGNIYLLKARATVLHKLWLETVTLKDQKLRGIIESPSFRDDMVFSQRGTRAIRKQIPGNTELYFKAKSAYEEIYLEALDHGFNSNYALLLCYSPDENDEKLSIELAQAAVDYYPTVGRVNNFAVVLYMNDEKVAANELLTSLALAFDDSYSEILEYSISDGYSSYILREMDVLLKMHQALNKEYVHTDFTPLLNIALSEYYNGNKEQAEVLAYDYISRYEATSSWAGHLAGLVGIEVPKEEKRKYLPVNGVIVGDSLEKLLQVWKKPANIITQYDGSELWEYDESGAKVYLVEGSITTITLTDKAGPKVNGKFGVGTGRNEVERELGKYKRMSETYFIYEGKQNLAIQYILGVAQEIVLYP